jgi:hypothetical protein
MEERLERYTAMEYPVDLFGFSNEEGDGCVAAFVDFEGVKGIGDTFEDAYVNAKELLESEIRRRLEKGETIPMPSPQENRRHQEALQAYNKKDHATAFALWLKEAEQLNTQAMVNIATLYAQGLGCARDMDTAIYWFKKASYLGNSSASYNLGRLYESGLFVPESRQDALYHYRLAAKREHSGAQFNLAMLLENEAIAEAFGWMLKAAYNGHPAAQESITHASNAELSAKEPLNGEFRSLDAASQADFILTLIDEKVKPALAMDGGNIEFVDMGIATAGNTVEVKLHYLGACSGCQLSSTSTADMILRLFEEAVDKNIRLYLW